MSLLSVVGQQSPRVRLVPHAHHNDLDDAVFLASSYGLAPDEWQETVLEGWLGLRRDNIWAAPRCGLAVPRQNGKNACLEIRELHGMISRGERVLHTAHEVKTARKAFLRLLSFFDNERKFPELAELVADVRRTNGQEAIVLENGGSIEFVARSKGSGRGFSVDVLVCDEAQELNEDALAALQPTISASPSPQLIMTGTPPGWSAEGGAFTRMRKAGLKGTDRRLCWLEWGCVGPVPVLDLDDVENLAAANPALGIRLSPETAADERATMDDDTYARERLGVWDDDEFAALIGFDQWRSLEDSDPVDEVSVFAVEVSMDRSFATVVSAGAVRGSQPTGPLAERLASTTGFKADGRDVPLTDALSSVMGDGVRVAVQRRDRGTSWVVDECLRLESECSPAGFVVDSGGPAGSLISDMEAAGLVVLPMSTGEVARACAWLVDAVQSGAVSHRPDRDLDLAVANVVPRPIGDGAFAFGRKLSTGADVTPLNGCAFAAWGHNEFGVIDPSAFVL
jgi:phage terminase large subunit-like protein